MILQSKPTLDSEDNVKKIVKDNNQIMKKVYKHDLITKDDLIKKVFEKDEEVIERFAERLLFYIKKDSELNDKIKRYNALKTEMYLIGSLSVVMLITSVWLFWTS